MQVVLEHVFCTTPFTSMAMEDTPLLPSDAVAVTLTAVPVATCPDGLLLTVIIGGVLSAESVACNTGDLAPGMSSRKQ